MGGGAVETESTGAVLQAYTRPDGRWAWCYRDADRGVELHSNRDYATREEAVLSARRAYPDVPFAPEADRPSS